MRKNPRPLDVTRSRRLVAWARPWRSSNAKPLDPQEPSLGRLVEELGEQLEAALDVIEVLRDSDLPETDPRSRFS